MSGSEWELDAFLAHEQFSKPIVLPPNDTDDLVDGLKSMLKIRFTEQKLASERRAGNI